MAPTCRAGPRDELDVTGHGGAAALCHEPPVTVVLEKAALRRQARALRSALGVEERARRSAAATERLLHLLPSLPEGPVACFHSIADEIDTAGLIAGLVSRGRPILLPRVVGRGQALQLHLWAPEQPLLSGGFGLSEPPPDAPVVAPAVVVAPLLAVDERGYRLGYGAGFYDRTLAALGEGGARFLSVGFAFDTQRVERVPVEATDVPLDMLVTDARVTRFGHCGPEGE